MSKRFIVVNGDRYKNLVKSGYYVNNQNQLTKSKNPTKVWVPKVKNPSNPLFNTTIFKSIVNELTANDLLALSLANKETIFTQDILDFLSNKYNIGKVKTFTEFIRLYNLSIVEPYLYQLENNIEMPSLEFTNLFLNNHRNINTGMRGKIYDWLILLNQTFKQDDYVLGLTMTLLDAYISKVDIDKNDLQSLSIVCHYLACQVLQETCPKIDQYLDMTDHSTHREQFHTLRNHVVDLLKGVIIRPSVVFFLDMDDIILRNFALLSFIPTKLMVYKPSLIAEAIQYIVTKEYKIYTLGEISQVCRIMIPLIEQLQTSTYKFLQNIGLALASYTHYTCGTDIANIKDSPFKYHKEWHIGEYQKIAKIGEGTYGEVVKIKRKECNQDFVIKKSTLIEPAIIEISVLKLLSTMKSEYNIHLCGFQLTNDKVHLYLPYMNTTVKKLVDNHVFNKDKFLIYANQMIMGLYECHRCDLIHRDIKIENIVYHEKEDLFKIIDYGISVPYASFRKTLSPNMASTFPYRAPEALFGLHYNYKIDIWALGCVFYYIFTQKYIIREDNWDMNSDGLNDICKLFGTPTNQDWPGVEDLVEDNYLGHYQRNEDYFHLVFGQHYDFIMPFFILNPANRTDTKQLLNLL